MSVQISMCMLLAFSQVMCGCCDKHNPTTGSTYTYDIPCQPLAEEASCHNKSLKDIAVHSGEWTNVQISISAPKLVLDTNVMFAQLNSLSIIGTSNSASIITCTGNNSGLELVNITRLILQSLMVTRCGARITTRIHRIYMSAIIIDRGEDVSITDVTIASSRGMGLIMLNHQGGGTVVIKSTTFKENDLPAEYKNYSHFEQRIRGGGGIFIGDILQENSTLRTHFQFDDCIFENNTAYTRFYDYLYTDNMGKTRNGYGRGGGAYLSLSKGLSNIDVLFSNCTFIGNRAFLGGGLSVKVSGGGYNQTTSNISIKIMDSLFKSNGCNKTKRETGFGGGAHLSFNAFKKSKTFNNEYVLQNVTFDSNCAQIGGGVFYFSSRQTIEDISKMDQISFDTCHFTQNKAHMGSAVNIMPNIFLRRSTGHTTVPRFKDCRFFGNMVNQSRPQQAQRTAGIGTIYVSLYDITLEGQNCFENNWGSPIYIVNGIVNAINSNMDFINNTGLNGGAIALIGVSSFQVGPNRYNFENNTAVYKGGAIYTFMIDNNDFTTSRSCFIQNQRLHSPWSAVFYFTGNRASDKTLGHSIFATTLIPCQVINNSTDDDYPSYVVIDITHVFSVRGIDINLGEVSTEGAHLDSKSNTRYIIPGESYSHGVEVSDDLGHSVDPSLRAMMFNKTIGVELHPDLSSVIGDKIQLIGEPGNVANVTLQTTSPQQAYIRMEVKLLDCPPGFKLENSMCICNSEGYVALFKCNPHKLHSHIMPGFWAGLVSDKNTPNRTELVTTICPFCDYSMASKDSSGVVLPRNKLKLNDHICGETRMGTLCGSCRENYTVHFHSPHFLCKPVNKKMCKLGWLFYILSELVPVTVVFITVLVLNISFTSGTFNGFILFSQLIGSLDIDASGIITRNLPDGDRNTIAYPTQVFQVIYGFFNLDLFNAESLSFCLWNGASALDMLVMKYVTVLYTLLLIVVVVCVIDNCGGNCLGKLCRITTVKSSVIHGISTFLIICYGQCIRVSLLLLTSVDLYVEKNSYLEPGLRVFYNGRLHYFSREHLPYALPALFCLLTVGLIPPTLLLVYPLLNKVMDVLGFEDDSKIYVLTRKLPISTLKPLLDSFQGCFKDRLRFFAGLYFLYRWVILLVFMNTTSYSTFYMIVGGMLVLILALHTISQPYIKRAHNIIDALLLTNLVLINGFSFFNYYRTRLNETIKHYSYGSAVEFARLQLVLIYLPLIAMGLYILIAFLKYLRKKGCKGQRPTILAPKRARKLRELVQSINNLDDDNEQDNEEELPHRLLAGEIDYAYFEDSD